MLITERTLGCERHLPVPFQGACDQSVVRINRLVSSTRQSCLIFRPLQPLLPLPVQLLTLKFDIFGDLEAHFDCGR